MNNAEQVASAGSMTPGVEARKATRGQSGVPANGSRRNRPGLAVVTYLKTQPAGGELQLEGNQARCLVFELIIDNPYMRLYFHEEAGIVHHEIRKPLEGKVFQETLSRGADLLESKRATKWLSDNRGHLGLSEADEAWGRAVWFPRVEAAGWTHWAIVRPHSAIGALNVSRLSQNYSKLGVTTRVFAEFEEALEWLKTC